MTHAEWNVALGEAGYPELLAEIDDPPAELWVRGRLPPGPTVAIVGSRRATRYGLNLATDFGRAAARVGWHVVSGLALGVDGAAHRGSIQGGTPGVAVLGTGTDVWYPRRHQRLGEELIEHGGATVSEYVSGTGPRPWHFPARNRIIVGLSLAVVVVEAADRSGALITARLAAENGREVFVVPGDVDRENSVGCNKLLRDGAHPVLGVGDLTESLELLVATHPRVSVERETPTLDEPGRSRATGGRGVGGLDDEERALIDLLTDGSSLVDDLVADRGREVLAIIGRLELKGVCAVEGGRVRVHI